VGDVGEGAIPKEDIENGLMELRKQEFMVG
jgi:hypothetical protein